MSFPSTPLLSYSVSGLLISRPWLVRSLVRRTVSRSRTSPPSWTEQPTVLLLVGSVRAETASPLELAAVKMLAEVGDAERAEKNPQKNSAVLTSRNRLIRGQIWSQLLSENLTFILKIILETLLELLLFLIINNTGCVVSKKKRLLIGQSTVAFFFFKFYFPECTFDSHIIKTWKYIVRAKSIFCFFPLPEPSTPLWTQG